MKIIDIKKEKMQKNNRKKLPQIHRKKIKFKSYRFTKFKNIAKDL